jgi:uncharacterized protein YecT (DUF1311 family)
MKLIFITLVHILAITTMFPQTHLPMFHSSPQIRLDGLAVFENNDKKLNQVYKMLLLAKQSDTTFIENIKASERLWIQFRDAEFTVKFPDHPPIENKDLLSNDQATYLARFTENRTKVLLEWLKTATSDLEERYDSENGPKPADVYISDMKVFRSANINGEVGINRPSWSDQLIIRGKKFNKGLVIQPMTSGTIAYVEYILLRPGGHLHAVAGRAEGAGGGREGRIRFRILVDNKLLYADEIGGSEWKIVDMELSHGRILRIETDDGFDGILNAYMAFGDLKIIY